MKKAGFVLAVIDGKVRECKVITAYANDTLRIEYPTFCNGRYNGTEQRTITQNEIYTEQ